MDATSASNLNEKIFAISVDEWKSSFASTVQAFPATRFVIVGVGPLVRLALKFGGADR
jgi:hypothetical protein